MSTECFCSRAMATSVRCWKRCSARGVHVAVISILISQPPMVADDLRRQADALIDLAELKPKLGRDPSERPGPREVRQQSPQFAARGPINGNAIAK
jgi:hypothetical protein